MKKVFISILLVNTFILFGQTNKESAEYLSKFFNGTQELYKYSGGFTYNSFDNSVVFSSESQIIDPITFEVISIIRRKYDISLSNIKNIEIIYDSYDKEQYVVLFNIFLNNSITEYNSIFK